MNCGHFGSTAKVCIKKSNFPSFLFLELKKLRSAARATFKNPKISLWIGKKWGVLNIGMKWIKLRSNLSYTVEGTVVKINFSLINFDSCSNYLVLSLPAKPYVMKMHCS